MWGSWIREISSVDTIKIYYIHVGKFQRIDRSNKNIKSQKL